ncbi:MAG TPA: (Fe-S)-binding protein, partial [Rudaea sp.]|nr:(Fe-S)-binding protein [Rudaea sp.]
MLVESGRGNRREPWLGFMVAHPRLLRAGLAVANLPGVREFLQCRAMQWLLRPTRLDRAVRELPRLPAQQRMPQVLSTSSPTRGRIGLFPGCIAASVDRDVHIAATQLLQALGYEIVLPQVQSCCGALQRHAGHLQHARTLATATHR